MSEQSRTLTNRITHSPEEDETNSSMSFFTKTSAFLGLTALRSLVSDSIAIDMGTDSTIIAVAGRDVVLDEPSVVAVNELTGEIIAFGHEAANMRGREGRDIKVVAPLMGGVVADFERTQKMLEHFVAQARKAGASQFSRRAMLSVISEITHVEQRALLDAAQSAHIGKVFMMEEGLAAAFGAGISPRDRRSSAVVDVGASTTNVAIIAGGNVVHSRSERIGSSNINAAIYAHLRKNRGLIIGEETTEHLKTDFVSPILPADLAQEMTIRGRAVEGGSPGAVDITTGELYPVVEAIVRRIWNVVDLALTELPAEVAADVHERGLILTGGGALLNGLDTYFREKTKLPVMIADEPRFATVRGLLQMFDEPLLLRRVVRNEPHLLQNAEVPFEA